MLPAAIEDTRLDFTSHSDNNSEGHGWTAIHTACDVSKAKVTTAGSHNDQFYHIDFYSGN